jgi:hypothetical protein
MAHSSVVDKRVVFDFEIAFSNGGGLKGWDFRLDIDGDDIDDAALADLHRPGHAPADGRHAFASTTSASSRKRTSGARESVTAEIGRITPTLSRKRERVSYPSVG